MKNIISLILLAILPLLSQAQTKGEKLHQMHANMEGFTSFSISGSFLNDMDMNIDDDSKGKKVTGDINEMKFLNLKGETQKHNNKFYLYSVKELSGRGYKEVLTEECEKDARFFARGKGKRYTEFHVLFHNDNRTMLISFFGQFKVSQLKSLCKMGMQKAHNK